MDKKSTKGMKPKQRLRSTSFRELCLRLVSELSYRDTTDVLNRALHREKRDSVKTSTMEDWVESFGKFGVLKKARDMAKNTKKVAQNCIDCAGFGLSVLSLTLAALAQKSKKVNKGHFSLQNASRS